jgi:hypothetical protein
VIRREKLSPALDVRVEGSADQKEEKDHMREGYGLSIVASCVNPDCIEYQQDAVIHLGYGVFIFYQLISGLKCEMCPYRSQFLRPTMMCKGVKLSHCFYKV